MADPKIDQITQDDGFRAKITAILETLSKKGYPDVAIIEAMRTKEQQAEKVRKGYSKTMKSYHLKRGSDKKGLAADICPRSVGWNAPKRYWMMLGWLCYRHAVGWGGLFGLKLREQKNLLEAMKRLSDKGWPQHDSDYETRMGWDGAHAQKDNNWDGVA